jgi:hypothetical protein
MMKAEEQLKASEFAAADDAAPIVRTTHSDSNHRKNL